MYEYKYIKKKELLQFIQSKFYNSCKIVPISTLRAISYVNNPKISNEDVVILMKLHEQELIAFRCVFYDSIETAEVNQKFAWISGSWVDEKYRRQGHSMDLIHKTCEVTNGYILFSNYAPESHNLYTKSGLFTPIVFQKGYKYFFNFTLAEILPQKKAFFKKIKVLLKLTDTILNKINKVKLLFLKDLTTNTGIKKLKKLPQLTDNIFNRNEKFFKYLKNYPWVSLKSNNKLISDKYIFSYKVQNYKVDFFEIDKQNIFAFKIRDDKLFMLYLYAEQTNYEQIALYILNYCKINKISILLSYFEELNKYFNKYKNRYVLKKHQNTNFYASSKMVKIFKENNLQIQPGDGDNIFA